jgi:hypothetical protein
MNFDKLRNCAFKEVKLYMKRQITESEKEIVRKQQIDSDGVLRCFISNEIIDIDIDEVEYDHIIPFSKGGASDVSNIRIVKKDYNRKKSNQSLYEIRDNIKLEQLFQSKKNNIKLQDIFLLKGIQNEEFKTIIKEDWIIIECGTSIRKYPLIKDSVLDVNYFYGRIPISWLENDDQEGLQPRVIDYKRLISLRNHLFEHPQLAPSIARLVDGRLKLFDGQHKLAAQILNNCKEIDIKAYISSSDKFEAKRLFDELMITNLDAHSKHKQIPFYTSTLLDRLSVIYRELLDEFTTAKPPENHSEENFINFLVIDKKHSKTDAKQMLRSAIIQNAIELSAFNSYTAHASRDTSYPLSVEILKIAIFPNTLYMEPSKSNFKSVQDFRDAELENFKKLSSLIVESTKIQNWVPKIRGKSLSNEELKARRIWHKGSVITWAPYLKSILGLSFGFITNDDWTLLLHRSEMSDVEYEKIKLCLSRLFNHPLWDEPEGELDSLLVSAQKQNDYFNKRGLTEKFVLVGVN